MFRGSPIKVTVVTNQARGKISVTSEITAKPLFSQIFGLDTKIKVLREAELPPYDVVFVVDESGSMRFSTFFTYIGRVWEGSGPGARSCSWRYLCSGSPRRCSWRWLCGAPQGGGNLLEDVVIYQSQRNSFPSRRSMITAGGMTYTVDVVTDVIINTPGVDIPVDATYDNGSRIYKSDPKRGTIVDTNRNRMSLRRTALSGLSINQLPALNVSAEDRQLAQTFMDNRSSGSSFNTYYNRSANYIEPHAGAVYGVMSFIDTVKIYGTSALKLGLSTFSTNSYSSDMSFVTWTDQMKTGATITGRNLVPYINLVNPSGFNEIVDKLTIMTSGNALGLPNSPIGVNSYPDGGTNINAGLMTAERTLDGSDRPGAERVIILFTDGEPTHSFTALGNEVKRLTGKGIRVYSIVLTLAISQSSVNNFKDAMENKGMAEPVVFIDDPAKLDEAFMQIADELGLKLIK